MVVLGLAAPAAMAVPYASAVTDLGGGDYSFVLNQDADQVFINRIGDTPLDLGPLTRGTYTFNLGVGTGFEIWVSSSTAVEWAKISDDEWNAVKFYSPKGVDLNRNPASRNFGWIYVAEALGGTTGGRTTTDGMYALLADCTDAIGQGDIARTGGEDWTIDTGGSSPWRLHVGEDDYVYVCDWSDAHSGLWRFNAELSGDATEVLDSSDRDPNSGLGTTHGSLVDFEVVGAGADFTVYTLDEDMGLNPLGGFIGKYEIGTGALPYVGAPTEVTDFDTEVVNGTLGLDIDSSGIFYWTQYRWNADYPSIIIFEDTGDPANPNILYSLIDVNLAYRGGIQVDEANDRIILGGYYGDFTIRDLNDPNAVLAFPGPNGYTRAVSYDIVGNVYAVNSSTERLTVWSPGGDWIAITRSDGTFTLMVPAECPGDVDGDGDTDLNDLAMLLAAYGSVPGDPNWNPACDFDGDNDVDLTDLGFLLSDYGCLP